MDIDFGQMEWRRLPVYLMIGTSSSMAGTKIAEVNNGLELVWQEMMADPRTAATVCLSVITFGDGAFQWPLAPITSFTPPHLVAGGACALGAALTLLNRSLDADIISNSSSRKGDYKPIAFLMMDCPPTDQWQDEAERLVSRATNRALNTIGLAIGQDADVGVIQQICKVVLKMQNVTPDQLRTFFDWVSASVKSPSQPSLIASDRATVLPTPDRGEDDMARRAVRAAHGIPAAPSIFEQSYMRAEHGIRAMPNIFGERDFPAEAPPTIFVSHSHADDAFTRRLVADLRAAGGDVWVDTSATRSGDFMQVISDALERSEWLVLVLTPDAVASPMVRLEVSAALHRAQQGFMHGVIPVLAGPCPPGSIPPLWDVLHRDDATHGYNSGLASLLDLLELS